MKAAFIGACLLTFVALGCPPASGQETTAAGDVRQSEARVPLAQAAVAFDVAGREAIHGRLRTQTLSGTPEAPARNTRIVLENRSQFFLTYVSGWATFYDSDGVRCGEGLWKLEAFAPLEQVEVDTPGLRLTCTPSTWRVVATTMLTRTGDVAKPPAGTPAPAETGLTTNPAATPGTSATTEAPVRNTRIVIENRSPVFYNYAAGWATFYGEDGVRCGEGLWKLEAFAPREQVEVDTPGLRLTCAPATWRIVATTLLTRTGDVAKPREQTAPPPAETGSATGSAQSAATGEAAATPAPAATSGGAAASTPPLEINVNGRTIPIQLGNPLEIVVGRERVRIVVQQAP